MNEANFESSDSLYRRVDLNWCEFLQKHKPQVNAVSAEVFLFFNSGLIVGTILYDRDLTEALWAKGNSHTFVTLSATTYFLGVILGVNVCSFFVRKWTKKKLKHLPCLIFVITGILLLVAPSSAVSVMLVRILSGVATGLIQVSFLVQGAEVAVSKMRGILLSSFSITFAAGICASVVVQLLDDVSGGFQAYRVLGILHLALVLFAELAHVFFNAESPLFLLQRDDLEGTVRTMMKLRNENMDSWDIRNDIQEMTLMLNEDKEFNRSLFRQGNLRPLCLISATMLLLVLCSGYPMNIVKIKTVDSLITTSSDYVYGAVILAAIKLFTTVLAVFAIDFFGRKRPLYVSGLGVGLLALTVAVVLVYSKDERFFLTDAAWCCVALEVMANLGATFIPYVYAGEAFCTPKKHLSIAFVLSLENLMQIVLLLSTYGYLARRELDEVFLVPATIGALIIIVSSMLVWFLPDTSNLSIWESAKKFRNVTTAVDGIPYS